VVNLRAVVDVEDVDGAGVLVDPVDDPVGTAPSSMTAGQGAEQRFADAVRIDREGGLTAPSRGRTRRSRARLSFRFVAALRPGADLAAGRRLPVAGASAPLATACHYRDEVLLRLLGPAAALVLSSAGA
jgi:hypothetical protein